MIHGRRRDWIRDLQRDRIVAVTRPVILTVTGSATVTGPLLVAVIESVTVAAILTVTGPVINLPPVP